MNYNINLDFVKSKLEELGFVLNTATKKDKYLTYVFDYYLNKTIYARCFYDDKGKLKYYELTYIPSFRYVVSPKLKDVDSNVFEKLIKSLGEILYLEQEEYNKNQKEMLKIIK